MAADRIGVRPGSARERLVNDRDAGCTRTIRRREVASPDERNPDCREVVWRGDAIDRPRRAFAETRDVGVNRERPAPRRQQRRAADARYARQRAHTLEDRREEGLLGGWIRIP